VNPAMQEAQVGGFQCKTSPRQKHETLSEKITKAKKGMGVGGKCEAPSSSPNTAKKCVCGGISGGETV
jgi:hypothetical protein